MTVYFKSLLTKTTTDPKKIFSKLTKQVVLKITLTLRNPRLTLPIFEQLPHAGICFSFLGVMVDAPQTFLPKHQDETDI